MTNGTNTGSLQFKIENLLGSSGSLQLKTQWASPNSKLFRSSWLAHGIRRQYVFDVLQIHSVQILSKMKAKTLVAIVVNKPP